MSIDIAAILAGPHNRSLLTTGPLSDDDELAGDCQIDLFAIPQVIQVAYPVRGTIINIYALPQVINIVIDE